MSELPPPMPPTVAPTKVRWLRRHPVWGALIGAFIGLGVGAATGQSSKTGPAGSAPEPSATVTVEVPGPTPQVTVTQTVQYTPPLPPGYRTTHTFKGRSGKQTDPFEIPSTATRWRICWDFRGDGNDIVHLRQPGSEGEELVLNDIGPAKDCSVRYEPVGAEYYLDISGGPFTITIQITG